MPALPKQNPARRNKTATRATLSRDHDVKMPPLPERMHRSDDGDDMIVGWHEMTLAWWADIWASPMAPEFEISDMHGLFVLAVLVDDFWRNPTTALAAEIRLQRMAFGLTPIDRRRLQWEIERVDEAQDQGQKRRAARKEHAVKEPKPDPRNVLKLA
ncbi:hypothetical protein VSH64_24920 [Amycolatopsis rhabdoformis]|uniref:DUF1376 domain-containing protein n=1 Tax=Amycolatopsis rhabdoformis TaxID=1448059 RepID=A0ABZ1HWY3_9PSEU|nr:hypothetical protein [Amycolatopsis rhabdoformis]WSE26121.1 hypothetical protein VSH64_24920 [Amycolatopsis rhabdoformis]